jgi:hypothetical protein
MSTSGITLNQLTRNQYIEAALRKLNVIADGQTLSTENYTNGTLAFNALIGEFRSLGMPLWTRSSYTLTPVASTQYYTFGIGQTYATAYPIKLLQAVRVDTSSGTRIPMEIVADYDFNLLPGNSSGFPIKVTYQPKVNLGILKLWPTPDTTAASNCTIQITYTKPTEYMSSSTDTLDAPEEWTNAIIYTLASRLAPEWGIPLPDRQMLDSTAEKLLNRALENGMEDASVFFTVERY